MFPGTVTLINRFTSKVPALVPLGLPLDLLATVTLKFHNPAPLVVYAASWSSFTANCQSAVRALPLIVVTEESGVTR